MEDLPFDIRSKRVLSYSMKRSDKPGPIRAGLARALAEYLRVTLADERPTERPDIRVIARLGKARHLGPPEEAVLSLRIENHSKSDFHLDGIAFQLRNGGTAPIPPNHVSGQVWRRKLEANGSQTVNLIVASLKASLRIEDVVGAVITDGINRRFERDQSVFSAEWAKVIES